MLNAGIFHSSMSRALKKKKKKYIYIYVFQFMYNRMTFIDMQFAM